MATKPNGTTTNPTMKNQTYNPPNRLPYRPNHHRRRNHRRSCSCRRCFCLCCCWSVLILCTILFLSAAAGVIFYFLYHPQLPSFSVSALKFSEFNLITSPDDTTRLTTKLNVTLSTKNHNKKLVYTYDPIDITVASRTQVAVGQGSFPGFVSTPGNITTIHSSLSVASQVLDVDAVSSLRSDMKNKNGLPLKILLDMNVVVNMDKLKSKKFGIRATCDGPIHGQVPKGKVATVADITNPKCKVELRIKILRWTF